MDKKNGRINKKGFLLFEDLKKDFIIYTRKKNKKKINFLRNGLLFGFGTTFSIVCICIHTLYSKNRNNTETTFFLFITISITFLSFH
jgi:uncharacterized membrane protein YedE/YeeE